MMYLIRNEYLVFNCNQCLVLNFTAIIFVSLLCHTVCRLALDCTNSFLKNVRTNIKCISAINVSLYSQPFKTSLLGSDGYCTLEHHWNNNFYVSQL